MRKTLFIHIGHYKTGTTALQGFLGQNRKFLERNKLNYAPTRIHLSKHSCFAFSLYRAVGVKSLMHGYNKPDTPETVWAELFDHVRRCSQRQVIISSEELMRLGTYPRASALLKAIVATAPDIDIRIIAYLRAPEEHVRSWYNQLVKMGIKVPDFNTALCSFIEPVHYDYAKALQPWIEIFGPEAVILRPYDATSRRDDSLYKDFLSIFGLDLPTRGIKLPQKDPNPRMDDRLVEMTRVMQNSGVPKDVVNWTGDRAKKYYEDERANVAPVGDHAFDAVRQQVLDGLQALEGLPHNGVDLALFRTRLPEAETPELVMAWRIAGLVLNELHFLRRRMAESDAEISARLRVLEEAMQMGARKLK